MEADKSDSVFITMACRTPIGKFQGQFSNYSAIELGSIAIKGALKRIDLTPNAVDQVIMGQVLTAGQGQNPARQAAVQAGVPYFTPAFTVNMLSASGLKAICLGYQAIRNNDAEIVVAGGQESCSKAEHTTHIRGSKIGNFVINDTLLSDGLTDAFNNLPMGHAAELLAKNSWISREAQDKYTIRSITKTHEAIEKNYFTKEIVPVVHKITSKTIKQDETTEKDLTLEKIAKFTPSFDIRGTVTSANAAQVTDGAAVVVLCNQKQAKQRGLNTVAEIVGFAESGVEPMEMPLASLRAIEKLLAKLNWNAREVELFEINEAYAVQVIVNTNRLGVDSGRVNINGGALALGQPGGASGARILVTLLYNLRRTKTKKGIAAISIGGGIGLAVAVQLC